MAEGRYTLLGARPSTCLLSPTLAFHRWHQYDSFRSFERKNTSWSFLDEVATTVQTVNQEHYAHWHRRFCKACGDLGAEVLPEVTTLWRLVVGWGTNPALEVGISLDHLLGFPYLPGSGVKGLVHHIAEQELLKVSDDGEPSIPLPRVSSLPPPTLLPSLRRALRIRALFGSIHLRKPTSKTEDEEEKTIEAPEAPFDRLEGWCKLVPDPLPDTDPWAQVRSSLALLCSDAPTGGMVTFFDAVPTPQMFALGEGRRVLTPDVLTPHKDNKPNPVLFLAVRDSVAFELRYRLALWPAEHPRDGEEGERAEALRGVTRDEMARQLERWSGRAVMELGAGGKTTAGYGYFLPRGQTLTNVELLEPPEKAKPDDSLSEAERYARRILPEGIQRSEAIAHLDKVLNWPEKDLDHAEKEKRRAVVQLFCNRFAEVIEGMRGRLVSAMKKRIRKIDQILEEEGS